MITLDAVSATAAFGSSAAAKTAALVLGNGQGRKVIAFIHMDASAQVSACTFNGVAMTLVKVKSDGATPARRVYIYEMLDKDLPAGGTYNLSVTPSGVCTGGICCVSIFGAAQSAAEATGEGSNTSAVASWENGITTLAPNAWVFEVSGANDRTFTPTAPQIERFDFKDGTAVAMAVSSKEVAAAGATTMKQTPNSTTAYAQAIASFAPSSSGGFFAFF